MSDQDWENRVWMHLPWDELAALGVVAIAWPLAAIAANDPRRPPTNNKTVVEPNGDRDGDDPS